MVKKYLKKYLADTARFLTSTFSQKENLLPESVKKSFVWPKNAKCCVTLTYDDGLNSHLDHAVPMLNAHDLRATFYPHIMSLDFQNRFNEWAEVVKKGHEIGNHTVFHPCRKKIGLSDEYDLRGYTIRRWIQEVELANWILQQLDGRAERSFGNTCWDNWVGQGNQKYCIGNLASGLFMAARGERNNSFVNPFSFYRYNLGTMCGDNMKASQLIDKVNQCASRGHWIIITFHGIGKNTHELFIETNEHEALLMWLEANKQTIWTTTLMQGIKHLST